MISNYILIIGAMKCGTTTLYDYLARHPQIATGNEKEPGFFAFESVWSRGLDWYDSQFSYDPSQHLYALDASTDYTKYPFCQNVLERIKASSPRQFKMIYIMRNPLRRIESHALHAHLTKAEIGAQRIEHRTHGLDSGISLPALTISRYAYQIDVFSEMYDKGQLLLLTLEKLVRSPQEVLDVVCNFLNIKPLLPETRLMSNVAASHYSPHQIYGSLRKIPALRHLARNVIPRTARQQIYQWSVALNRPKERFSLNANEERIIVSLLMSDLIRLRDRYGIDVESEWDLII